MNKYKIYKNNEILNNLFIGILIIVYIVYNINLLLIFIY
jgi:hypothetical protein